MEEETSWDMTLQSSGSEEAGRRNRKPPKESHKAGITGFLLPGQMWPAIYVFGF